MGQKSYGDPNRWKTWPWRKAATAVKQARRAARTYGQPDGDLNKEIVARIHLLPCTYCGVMPANGADHELPFKLGGQNVLANLVPACLKCNQRRGAFVLLALVGKASPAATLWPDGVPLARGLRDQWHPPRKTHCSEGHAYSMHPNGQWRCWTCVNARRRVPTDTD